MRHGPDKESQPWLGWQRRIALLVVGASMGALWLTLAASPAAATVTVGQLAPLNPPNTCSSGAPADILQPTVASGNSYSVKGDGTIVAWSTSAQTGAGQMFKLKVFRKVAEPATYQAVAQDIFRPLAPGVVNAFSVSIPVKAGDFIGNGFTGSTNCVFAAPGESYLLAAPALADGQSSATFISGSNYRANVSAVTEPSNGFTIGALQKNKKKGTAKLALNLPGPGELVLSGNGVKAGAVQAVPTPGQAQLTIRAKGKKKTTLLDTGKVKLNVGVTYTPTGGVPGTQSTKVSLKRN